MLEDGGTKHSGGSAPESVGAWPRELTEAQQEVVSYPREGGGSLFVQGLPGTGKSTALTARLAALLREGRKPQEILVLLPQRALAERWEAMLAATDLPVVGGMELVTHAGFAQRMLALFWPLVAELAGFAEADREPTFLTIETTQYYMWRLVEPLVASEGYFADIAIRRGRLLAQLIDNLNKGAVAGFPHTEIYPRLEASWSGSAERLNTFRQAQECATRFREYCLAHNLLDFSLVIETFDRHLLPSAEFERFFRGRFQHLLVDNLEENVPAAHRLVRWALGGMASSVLAHDTGGGYRVFLGADAEGAQALREVCDEALEIAEPIVSSADSLALAARISEALHAPMAGPVPSGDARRAVIDQGPADSRFWISMVRWVAQQVAHLVDQGTPAGKIAVIGPYISDVLRFTLEEELAERGISLHLLRPATPLREDPVIRAMLTLALLAHPQWEVEVQGEEYILGLEDVALALETAIGGLDPVRARHLAEAALPPGERTLADLSGEEETTQAAGRLWERVGFHARAQYVALRDWITAYQQGEPEPLDIFLSRLFGDLLSRPEFGLHGDRVRARSYGRLVESAAKFRAAVGREPELDRSRISCEYVQLILGDIASAVYDLDWPEPTDDAVILAPAYAYLTRDLRSSYQFWVDLGSSGWWNRPNQPLTHPYVLSSGWPVGKPWRDSDEDRARREALARVLQGLAARCTKGIYLASSQLGVGGEEQDGRLLRVLMTALTQEPQHD